MSQVCLTEGTLGNVTGACLDLSSRMTEFLFRRTDDSGALLVSAVVFRVLCKPLDKVLRHDVGHRITPFGPRSDGSVRSFLGFVEWVNVC